MKKYFLFAAIISVAFVVKAQNSGSTKPYLTKSLGSDAITTIEANTSGGSIEVSGGNNEEARIEVHISGNWPHRDLSKEEIQSRLDADYEMSLSASGGKLTAIAKRKKPFMNWKKALNISFRIFVPEHVSTELFTSGGSISITNLSGTQDFKTSGGSLSIKKITGKMNGKTSGGSIKVSDSKEDIDLTTSGGSIEASNCTGKIRLNTSGGSLTLTDLSGDIKAGTSGGSVHGKNIEGELTTRTSGGSIRLHDLSCSLDASTSGGNIQAEITAVGKYVRLNNSGGSIDLQIPKDKGYDVKLYGERIHTASLINFTGTTNKTKLEGTINGGGIEVKAASSGGTINMTFR